MVSCGSGKAVWGHLHGDLSTVSFNIGGTRARMHPACVRVSGVTKCYLLSRPYWAGAPGSQGASLGDSPDTSLDVGLVATALIAQFLTEMNRASET